MLRLDSSDSANGFVLPAKCRGAVDVRRQQRLHEDVHVGRQARQEGHADLQRVYLVLRPKRLIHEVDCAIAELQVGEDEARRLFGFRLGRVLGLTEPVNDVGEIEALISGTHDANARRIDAQLFDHGGAAEEGAPRRIHVQVADVDEWRLAVALGNVELVDVKP